jgi:hypothetical protein
MNVPVSSVSNDHFRPVFAARSKREEVAGIGVERVVPETVIDRQSVVEAIEVRRRYRTDHRPLERSPPAGQK